MHERQLLMESQRGERDRVKEERKQGIESSGHQRERRATSENKVLLVGIVSGVRVLLLLLVLAPLLSPSSAAAHFRWDLEGQSSAIQGSVNLGQFVDEADMKALVWNPRPFPIRVRCRLVARTFWCPDANNDGICDAGTETSWATKWFQMGIRGSGPSGPRKKIKVVHVTIPHPDRGPESTSTLYGYDYFSGWEGGRPLSRMNHCHGERLRDRS